MKLLDDGENKVLPIPKELAFDGDEAIVRKEGDRLIVEPVRKRGLIELLDAMEPLDETLPDIDDGDLLPLDDPEL